MRPSRQRWRLTPRKRAWNVIAGFTYPTTIEDVSDTWGAYQILSRPALDDVLHRYADNALLIESDTGERVDVRCSGEGLANPLRVGSRAANDPLRRVGRVGPAPAEHGRVAFDRHSAALIGVPDS
jgi:hypothetical protein